MGIIAVIVVLGALIFIHELGHFLAAKALKIGVATFSLGFGPKLFSKKIGKTTYALSLLPLGGYVATVGEYDDQVEELGFTEDEVMTTRPPWQRLVLALAGPVANILLALCIYWGVAYHLGEIFIPPQITQIQENSPASAAGLQANDIVISINDIPIDNWEQVAKIINSSKGQNLNIRVERDNNLLDILVAAKPTMMKNVFGEDEEHFVIGVQAGGQYNTVPVSLTKAFFMGVDECYNMVSLTYQSLAKLITGSVSSDQLGGPIMIAQMVGEQAKIGILPVLLLAALISINLGILNLLPVPVLDGGLIVFCLIEMVTRKPINEKIKNASMVVGIVLLLSLMVFATYNDIVRIING